MEQFENINKELLREIDKLRRALKDSEMLKNRCFLAEEKAEKSEAKYRSIFSFLPYAVFTTDTYGRLLEYNEQTDQIFKKITGRSAKYFLDKTYEEFGMLDKKNLDLARNEFTKAVRGKVTGKTVYAITADKEEKFHVEVVNIPIFDKNVVQFILNVGQDVTESFLAEERLRNSEERFKTFFEYAPDAYFMSDMEGAFVEGNLASERLTGYKKSELAGKSFTQANILSADQLPKAALILAKNVMGKPTGPDEFVVRSKDGTEKVVEINTFPVKLRDKTVVLGSARDITERKKAERALRESESNYRTVFNAFIDPLFIHDVRTGAIIDANEQASLATGYTLEELRKMQVEDFSTAVEPYVQKSAISYVQKAAEGKVQVFEWHIKDRAGNISCAEVSLKPILLNGVKRVLAHVKDITSRKESEKALRQYIRELEIYHNASIGREERILELKDEIKQLTRSLGKAEA
ncbi:MAG: PAS domain S-box protein [Candidatus Omnitrophica bacterium]|nr:PAS domain S-box protein [Candidatus Omnitrophota bacterium]